jgi:hypothetical protein
MKKLNLLGLIFLTNYSYNSRLNLEKFKLLKGIFYLKNRIDYLKFKRRIIL